MEDMKQGQENELLWKEHLEAYLETLILMAEPFSRMDKFGVDLVAVGEGDFFPEVLQVKSYIKGHGNYGALSHLEKGIDNGCIIPLVVGLPALELHGGKPYLRADIEQALACDGIWVSPSVQAEESGVKEFMARYAEAYSKNGIKYMHELGLSKKDARS
jgi:hypothetical protein